MTEASKRWLTAAGWVYFTLLFGWLAVYLLTGDRFGMVALANNVAVYLFFPLPLALGVAAWTGRRELWAGVAAGLVVFLWLWGGLFLPRTRPARAEEQALTVMTYNILGQHGQPGPVVEVIRREAPDVVALQELTPVLAEAVRRELAGEYPYQLHQPEPGVTGMGVISKFPIRPAAEALPLDWVGTPQSLVLDWNGQPVSLVNFHMWPTPLWPPSYVAVVCRAREAQAQALADYAGRAAQRGPVIALGDANATELSDVYRIVTGTLIDSWQEAGFGLGHTFPGAANDWSARPAVGPFAVPQWLVRIDYVFHSAHFRAVAARTAQVDGVSDHRGVVVTLALTSGE